MFYLIVVFLNLLYNEQQYISKYLGVGGGGGKNIPLKSPRCGCNGSNQYF